MIKITKILCPTDFSNPSLEALKIANDFALDYKAKLYIVNVVTPIPILSAPPGFTTPGLSTSMDLVAYRKTLEEAAQAQLNDLVKSNIASQVETIPIVTYGNAAEQILKIADSENVDLIVIATHGRTGWKHLVFGSVAEKIIRMAKQPVLTIRKPNN